MIERQGGNPRVVDDYSLLPTASKRLHFPAERDGYVVMLRADLIGRASMALGAGRDRVDATIDPAAGIVLHAKPGDRVEAGAPILTMHLGRNARLDSAIALLDGAVAIGAERPPATPLVIDVVGP